MLPSPDRAQGLDNYRDGITLEQRCNCGVNTIPTKFVLNFSCGKEGWVPDTSDNLKDLNQFMMD